MKSLTALILVIGGVLGLMSCTAPGENPPVGTTTSFTLDSLPVESTIEGPFPIPTTTTPPDSLPVEPMEEEPTPIP